MNISLQTKSIKVNLLMQYQLTVYALKFTQQFNLDFNFHHSLTLSDVSIYIFFYPILQYIKHNGFVPKYKRIQLMCSHTSKSQSLLWQMHLHFGTQLMLNIKKGTYQCCNANYHKSCYPAAFQCSHVYVGECFVNSTWTLRWRGCACDKWSTALLNTMLYYKM